MILSRGFELLTGSLLSYFELNNGGRGRKSYSILNQICPSLGVILIIYSFLFFNLTKIFHPSFITLIPLIGVSLIIWFSKKGGLITEILSSKIFVFFGLISYSLYLWHYPIFAFLRYIDIFNNSIWIKLLAVLLTIILSIISYYLIERPFRN
jgi:peptidoglycan/LPS O-acetylase OafA/YrhL